MNYVNRNTCTACGQYISGITGHECKPPILTVTAVNIPTYISANL